MVRFVKKKLRNYNKIAQRMRDHLCVSTITWMCFTSYCVHLLDVQGFDNAAEVLKLNMAKDKCGDVADN